MIRTFAPASICLFGDRQLDVQGEAIYSTLGVGVKASVESMPGAHLIIRQPNGAESRAQITPVGLREKKGDRKGLILLEYTYQFMRSAKKIRGTKILLSTDIPSKLPISNAPILTAISASMCQLLHIPQDLGRQYLLALKYLREIQESKTLAPEILASLLGGYIYISNFEGKLKWKSLDTYPIEVVLGYCEMNEIEEDIMSMIPKDKNIGEEEKLTMKIGEHFSNIIVEAKKAITTEDKDSLSLLIAQSQSLIETREQSTPEIKKGVQAALQAGALAAKTTLLSRNQIALALTDKKHQHLVVSSLYKNDLCALPTVMGREKIKNVLF